MRVRLNGPFRVFDDQDRDVTPKGIKERGLLALVLLSPGQRRTRAWVQDKLWSDRTPEQASASFRQALSKVRKGLGPLRTRVQSDRSAIWMDPPVSLEHALDPSRGDLLDDIDITDPEFSDWLRLLRMHHHDTSTTPMGPSPPRKVTERRPIALICSTDRSGTSRGQFILRTLSQRIASGLARIVELDVIESDDGTALSSDEQPAVRIELECLDDSEMAFVLLRVLGQPSRRIVWSGRLTVAPRLSVIWESHDVTRALNQTIQAVCDTVVSTAGLTPMAAIQKAIRRIYDCDRNGLTKADDLLRCAMDGEGRGQALAWRGMVRLSEIVEFRESNADRLAEAIEFASQAAQLAPTDTVVQALVSEITLMLTQDIDKAAFFASRAMKLDDQDPESLAALGRTLSYQGRHDNSHQVALVARQNAQGLSQSSEWDLMACVAKIGIGDMKGAIDLALTSHRKMPFGRHALRYLTVLSCLADKPEDAAQFAGRLRRLEPDFSLQLMMGPYQPLPNLGYVDLLDTLRAKLA